MEELDYYDELLENSKYEYCPRCGEFLDGENFDFQICGNCCWDDDEGDVE